MTRKPAPKFLALVLVLLWGDPLRGAVADASKPNFIIIFADDLGYRDLGVFGSPDIKTPNIDRMAKEGRVFASFYVASPVHTASPGGRTLE